MNNIKLIQLIRESINDYIREIDEAGNVAALEAKMNKTQEAIDKRKKMVAMEGLDEDMKGMIDEKKIKDTNAEIKALEKSLVKYQKQLDKIKSKSEKSEKVEDTEEKEIVDEITIGEDSDNKEYDKEAELNESFLYMQKLAGLITEAQYKQKFNSK
jgi:predicted  nucleic acid-binding Zn-ribbon protein